MASATVFLQGGQYILADGSVIAYGKDFDQVPLTAGSAPDPQSTRGYPNIG